LLTKLNVAFAVFGILVGFIAGYMMHEVLAARQPPRLTPELRAMITTGEENGGPAAAPGPANAGMPQGADPAAGGPAGGGPAMAEVQQLRAYVEKNPNDAEAVLQLANLNFDIRQFQRSQELYTQYLKLRPTDANVLTDLGISYRETKNFDQALEQFQKARKLAPDHWQSYYNEVVVLAFDLNRHDEATRILAELQRLQPSNPDVEKLAKAVTSQRKAA
jgi:cytochrome c-type biogenesis protein CcmH/NrfG